MSETLPPNRINEGVKTLTSDVLAERAHTLDKHVATFKDMGEKVVNLIASKREGFTYDDYFETVIPLYPHKLLSSYLRYVIPGKQNIGKIIEEFSSLGEQYSELLVDPGIAIRHEIFMPFARNVLAYEPGLEPLELRRRFIASDNFQVCTYYRGLIEEDENSEQRPSPLASTFRDALINPSEALTKYYDRLDWWRSSYDYALEHGEDQYIDNERGFANMLPILVQDDFLEDARMHVQHGYSADTGFVSISGYPQIPWYFYADNGQDRWKNWDKKTNLKIYQFSMNSFYALSRSIITPGFTDEAYHIGSLSVPVSDSQVELLVPIGLPQNYTDNPRSYRPTLGENDEPTSFQAPESSDWEIHE